MPYGSVKVDSIVTSTKTVTVDTVESQASGALPKSGGTMTGAITFANNQSFSDTYGSLRTLPQNSQNSSYTLTAADTGRHVKITTGGVTVPAEVFNVGAIITIYNDSASLQIITQGSSVIMRQAGTANTGNRTLAQYGVATVLCVSSNTFVISGSGVN